MCKLFGSNFQKGLAGKSKLGTVVCFDPKCSIRTESCSLLTFDWTVPEALLDICELLPSESERDVLLPLLLWVPDLPGNL